jgi:hypothetical protein
LIPDPSNPQAFNRYSYVYGNPLRYIDPTGHGTECGFGESCVVDPYTSPILSTKTVNNTGNAKAGSSEEDEGIIEEVAEVPSCGYHHCGETFDVFEAYELGWQNFGQAWDIYWNPNATYGQRFAAGAYMGAWGGAHLCLVLCTAVALAEFLVPGAISCSINIKCPERVFWVGGEVAKAAAQAWAKAHNGITIEMTRSGRQLEIITREMDYLLQARPLWRDASRLFAQGAKGNAHVFINTNPVYFNNTNSIWASYEYPALLVNDAVTNIIPYLVGP